MAKLRTLRQGGFLYLTLDDARTIDERGGETIPVPSGAGRSRPLRSARHTRTEFPAARGAGWRRHGLAARRSAGQGIRADAARLPGGRARGVARSLRSG